MFLTAAATAFNLLCAGTLHADSFASKRDEPYSVTYRVDLAAKKWCDGECRAIREIADIQPASLQLEEPRDINTPTQKEFFSSSIDRETGRHSMVSTSGHREGILILKWEGHCEKADFTGFPEFQTKF
jgi:hypothetical protein